MCWGLQWGWCWGDVRSLFDWLAGWLVGEWIIVGDSEWRMVVDEGGE